MGAERKTKADIETAESHSELQIAARVILRQAEKLTRLNSETRDLKKELAEFKKESEQQVKRLTKELHWFERDRERTMSSLTWRVVRLAKSPFAAFRSRQQQKQDERLVAASELFDTAYYLDRYPDIRGLKQTPLQHYLTYGEKEGRRPHPLFDPNWYLEQNPDVARGGHSPLIHFIMYGAREGRDPNRYFDIRWYCRMNPDVRASGLNPVAHYMKIGASNHADPSPRFSTKWYLSVYDDVAQANINPLAHYLTYGYREGRRRGSDTASTVFGRPVEETAIECLKRPIVKPQMALFVTHSRDGQLKPHVRHYLEALKQENIGVVLIVAADTLFTGHEPWLYELVDGLFIRDNEGFDFAAWAHVLRLHRELYGAEILYWLNDSILGPVTGKAFHSVINRVRAESADLIGLTDNYERGWHIQSYFLALKQGALRSPILHEFVSDIVSFADKDDVIEAYEVTLARKLVAAGLNAVALFPSQTAENATLFQWKELLDSGFPFVKVMALREILAGAGKRKWRKELATHGLNLSMIDRVLNDGGLARTPRISWNMAARSEIPEQRRVAFIGPWNYDNGLGVASRGYMSAFMRTGFSLNLIPIGQPFNVHKRVAPTRAACEFIGPPDISVVHLNPEAWKPLLTKDAENVIAKSAMTIGAFIWEAHELPSDFEERAEHVDAIWAPTHYCAESMRATLNRPVDVVHYPVPLRANASSAGSKEMRQRLGIADFDRIILYAFDTSSYLMRKNPLALVVAFQETGLAGEGWRLVLKAKHLSTDPSAAETLRRKSEECRGTILIDGPMSREDMRALMAMADIYASPHCSEGFGLTIAEAMSMGKIVVATDYGGPRDFLDVKTGFPVKYHIWQLEHDEGPYRKGTTWARVDELHLAESLRAAAALDESRRQVLAERARQKVIDVLSPAAVAAEMEASIARLLGRGRQAIGSR